MNSLNGKPPDDTGSDTLNRYRYQAVIALQYCIKCATEDSAISVFVEYFEDIVVEYENEWHFIQVKSRDRSRSKWTLNSAINGIRSLYRAYCNARTNNNKYILMVEGVISARDDILTKLQPTNDSKLSEEEKNDIKKKLEKEIDSEIVDIDNFVKNLVFRPSLPTRERIDDHVIRQLASKTNNVSHGEIEAIYENAVGEIINAMSQTSKEDTSYDPSAIKNYEEAKESKKFNEDRIMGLIGSILNGPYPLLKRELDVTRGYPTNLEKKLLASGARQSTVKSAKNLRSNAYRRAERAKILGYSLEELEDVDFRVEVRVNTVVQKHHREEYPIDNIWGEALDTLSRNKNVVDQNGVYRSDPDLLLGVACELSDQCKINWGVEIE